MRSLQTELPGLYFTRTLRRATAVAASAALVFLTTDCRVDKVAKIEVAPGR